jgi:RNA polymerase primary sigma factor
MYLLRSQHEKPLSLEEIGQKYDLTRERVRQIRDITLYKLKKNHSIPAC